MDCAGEGRFSFISTVPTNMESRTFKDVEDAGWKLEEPI